MYRVAITALLLFGMTGCGGGGIQEGMPANAGGGLTPQQQKEHDDMVAQEEAAAKEAKGKERK